MFYRNDSNMEPYPIQLPGCSLDCPLEDFVKITKGSISDDRDKECQLPSPGSDKGGLLIRTAIRTKKPFKCHIKLLFLLCVEEVIIGLALSGCVLFVLIALLLFFICRLKETGSSGYQHVNQEAGEES